MLKLRVFVFAVAAMLIAGSSAVSSAADISVTGRRLSLSGEIRSGDSERLAMYLKEADQWSVLYLDSLGGNLGEAMRLASLIKGSHLRVDVKIGGKCASACFFLYLAGEQRAAAGANDDGTLPTHKNISEWLGFVGIHRPYIAVSGGDTSSIAKQEDMMQKVRSSLMADGVPQHLIDLMMSRPSNETYWLSQKDLDLFGEYNPGIEEALIAKCGYVRPRKVSTEQWDMERKRRMWICSGDIVYATSEPLRREFSAKLRTGWRPWKM